MRAAIEAQALAAQSTVEFIQEVGFLPEDQDDDPFFPTDTGTGNASRAKNANIGEVRNVVFKYTTTKTTEDGSEDDREVSLTVPILTIVPIPFLRIQEMTIDFSSKITEEIRRKDTKGTNVNFNSSVSGGFSSFWSPVKVNFKTSLSIGHKSTSLRESRYNTEHRIEINVKAVQDDLPKGLARMLDILETAINEKDDDGGN
jgi:hypothetical protein